MQKYAKNIQKKLYKIQNIQKIYKHTLLWFSEHIKMLEGKEHFIL